MNITKKDSLVWISYPEGNCQTTAVASLDGKLNVASAITQPGAAANSSTPFQASLGATFTQLACGHGYLMKSVESGIPYEVTNAKQGNLGADSGRIVCPFPESFDISNLTAPNSNGNGGYTMTTSFFNDKPTYRNENGWWITWNGTDWSLTDGFPPNFDTEIKNGDSEPNGGSWGSGNPGPVISPPVDTMFENAAIRDDGLWIWGFFTPYNQSSNIYADMFGVPSDHAEPTKVSMFPGTPTQVIIQGGPFSAALVDPTGGLWAQGGNSMYELGLGHSNFVDEFTKIADDVVHVEYKDAEGALFIKSDGTLWGFGRQRVGHIGWSHLANSYEEFDDLPVASRHIKTPMQISPADATDVISVQVGYYAIWFVKEDGSLWQRIARTEVTTQILPSGVTEVLTSRGGAGSIFITKTDGSLWAMGDNEYGQLGIPGTTGTPPYGGWPDQETFVRIVESGVHAFSWGQASSNSGGHMGAYVKDDGSVWVWGKNQYGELGQDVDFGGNVTVQPVYAPIEIIPAPPANEPRYIDVRVLNFPSALHLLKSDGSMWAFGVNTTPLGISGSLGEPRGPYNNKVIDPPHQLQFGSTPTSSEYYSYDL